MLWEEGGRRRAKDLELLSENIDGTEPVAVSLQPKTHVNVARVGLRLGKAILFFSKAIFIHLEGKADWNFKYVVFCLCWDLCFKSTFTDKTYDCAYQVLPLN